MRERAENEAVDVRRYKGAKIIIMMPGNIKRKLSFLLLVKSKTTEKNDFIQLHFKLFNGVNVFIVELYLLYQTPTTGYYIW